MPKKKDDYIELFNIQTSLIFFFSWGNNNKNLLINIFLFVQMYKML